MERCPVAFRGWITGALILALAACATLPKPQQLREATPGVDAKLRALEAEGFAGQALIALGDEVLLLSSYGTMGLNDPRPVTATAVMPLASITKPFTASAVFALAAEGRLALEDPIGKHLPELDEHYGSMSIANVLRHTAGLPAEIVNRQWPGDPHFEPIERRVFLDRVQKFPPEHPPGHRFNYSNVGYSLAAALVETVSEQAWEDFLDGSLLTTAGITEIGLLRPGWEPLELVRSRDQAADHGHHLDQPRLADGLGWNLRGSGDLLARPEGILAWWYSIRQGRWLSEPWLTRWLERPGNADRAVAFGYGLMFRQTELGASIGHTGSQLAFTADLRWYRELDLLVYVNSAHADFRADQLADRIEQALSTRSVVAQ